MIYIYIYHLYLNLLSNQYFLTRIFENLILTKIEISIKSKFLLLSFYPESVIILI